MKTRLLAVALALGAPPAAAYAQTVYVAPTPEVSVTAPAPPVYAPPAPPVYVPPRPPVYAPPPPRVYVRPPAYYAPPPPHVWIRQRVRWHIRRAAAALLGAIPPAVIVAPAPPTVYVNPPVAPLPPIPPPVVAPPPCCYGPPPTVYVEPAPAPAVVVVRPQQPGWTSRIGLGVRGTGQVVSDSWNNVGIGGEFLARISNHWTLELAAEYQKNTQGPIDRIDIPATIGFRLHIGNPRWFLSPYLVAAAGFDYANEDLRVHSDEAYYFDAQVGGGLELRLGQHFAITADARFDGKKRIDDPSPAVVATTSINGKPVHPLGDEYGGQFRLGVAVYF